MGMYRLVKIAILIIFLPLQSQAILGMMGRNHCSYQQQPYRPNPNDYRQRAQIEIRYYEEQRQALDRQLSLLSNRQLKLQGQIRSYFGTPWSEAMLAHMDNGYDCCPSSRVYAFTDKGDKTRSIASEVTTSSEIVPIQIDAPPPLSEPPEIIPTENVSCFGYNNQYCASGWRRGRPVSPPRGAQCPRTGFHQTPAWYYSACHNEGRVNPEVCADSQISTRPANYRVCIELLENYRQVSYKKRRLASLLQDVNNSIYAAKYPNRPLPENYSGEVKSSSDGGLLNGLGQVLGKVAQVALPFVLQGGVSYLDRPQPRYRGNYGQRRRPPPGSPIHRLPPGAISRGPVYTPNSPQSTFYGPRYGYPFSQGGSYGQINPGLISGGFGCSQGSNGGGTNLLGSLLAMSMGGASSGRSPAGTFGAFGGNSLFYALNLAMGNRMPGMQSWQLGGRQGPYHPGGLRFGSRLNMNSGGGGIGSYFSSLFQGNQSVPNYYSRSYPYGSRGTNGLLSSGYDPRLQFNVRRPSLPNYLNRSYSRLYTGDPRYKSYYYQQNLRDRTRWQQHQSRLQAMQVYQNQTSFQVQARMMQLQDQLNSLSYQRRRYNPYVYRTPDFYYRTRHDYSYQNPGFDGRIQFNVPSLLMHIGSGLGGDN